MACKSLKGKGVNSGLRLVYAHFQKMEKIEQDGEIIRTESREKIVLVELYHINNKTIEDRDRIKRHFK